MRLCDADFVYYFESLAHGLNMSELYQKNGINVSNSLAEKIHRLVEESQANDKRIKTHVLEMEGLFENSFALNDRYLLFRDYDQVGYIDLQEPKFQQEQL